MYIKNTAGQNLGFLLVNCCGGPITGATVGVERSIDGASQAAATGTVTELGGGQYNLALSQADTNGDEISFLFAAANAVPVEKTITTTSGSSGADVGIFGGLQPPIMQAGKLLLPPYMKQFADVATTTAARYYIACLAVVRTTTFAGALTKNSLGTDSGKKIKMAVYNEATAGGSGTLAKDFGEITLDSSTAIRQFASSWTASPGRYYVTLVTDDSVSLVSMGNVYASGAPLSFGWFVPPAFIAETLSSDFKAPYCGDYVDGTYANFPESTAITATHSYYGNQPSNSPFPLIGLYT